MKILSGVHNHTTFSDGAQSTAEMAERALELGFVSFGVSDHSDTPWDDPADCLHRENYPAYLRAVAEVKERFAGTLEVLCGIEKDRESEVDLSAFDYVIGSVHFLPGKSGDCYSIDYPVKKQYDFLRFECGGDKLEFARRYFDAVADHAARCPFPILGHFDVITKYGLFDDAGDAYRAIALSALDAVLESTPYIEVNTGALSRHGREEPYPAGYLLRRVREKGGRVILGADAHAAADLDGGFDRAVALLKQAGFDRVSRLRAFGFEEIGL